MTRREMPSRHGRAADGLIATYVRELLADDEQDAVPASDATAVAEPPQPVIDASPARAVAADAAL